MSSSKTKRSPPWLRNWGGGQVTSRMETVEIGVENDRDPSS